MSEHLERYIWLMGQHNLFYKLLLIGRLQAAMHTLLLLIADVFGDTFDVL